MAVLQYPFPGQTISSPSLCQWLLYTIKLSHTRSSLPIPTSLPYPDIQVSRHRAYSRCWARPILGAQHMGESRVPRNDSHLAAFASTTLLAETNCIHSANRGFRRNILSHIGNVSDTFNRSELYGSHDTLPITVYAVTVRACTSNQDILNALDNRHVSLILPSTEQGWKVRLPSRKYT